jgi:hypothetical protein
MKDTKTSIWLEIIIRMAIGLVVIVCTIIFVIVFLDLYYTLKWNWVVIIVSLILISGFLFAAYLIGALILFLIPRVKNLVSNTD